VHWRETASVIATFDLAGLALLDGFLVIGFVPIGRVGVITGVDVPIAVGEELLLVIVIVVGVDAIVVVRLLPIPNISISRPATIAAILIAATATLRFNRFSLSIVMDNALVFDRGEWSWPFVSTLLVGDDDLGLGRFLGFDGGGGGDGLLGGVIAS
jgi:hypothetical protein